METIAKFEDPGIGKILVPTFEAFTPILEKRRDQLLDTNKSTLQYGRTSRHLMDIYYPEPVNLFETKKVPVLFFFYGGGFTTGSRTLPKPYDLVYSNIGWYFSQKGFVTIIPDYRLVPEIQFPSPADDVYQAVSWSIENREKIEDEGDVPYELEFDSVVLMGHASGAVHLTTALLMPGLLSVDPETRDRIAGVVLVSGTYNTHALPADDPVADVLAQYWGTFEATKVNAPQALLECAPEDLVGGLPEILMMDAEKEPHWLEVGAKDFQKKLAERTGKRDVTVMLDCAASASAENQDIEIPELQLGFVTRVVAKIHNHISVHLSPGSGEGEEWADAAIKWMKTVMISKEMSDSEQ
ncbi:hypothetical protein AX15_002031 [Amanita polypyramis BW_CC]|nr:hypothetical protein AX15_002031 [Amanita polypyramis BW_CC]